MLKYFLLLIFIIFSLKPSLSQNTQTEMAFYNVGFGAVTGGLGALINKKPTEDWKKTFLNGMWRGALGGYLIYESKNVIKRIYIHDRLSYSWYAKLLNAAGVSILEDAAANRKFAERWHINFGFNRIEFLTNNGLRIRYRILPTSLITTISYAFNSKFHAGNSLKTGEFFFTRDSLFNNSEANVVSNIMLFKNTSLNYRQQHIDFYNIVSHEIIHVYQHYDFNSFNTYYLKGLSQLEEQSSFMKLFNSLFYLDLNYIIKYGLYQFENIGINCYYDNLIEFEAGFYSNTIQCP